MAVDPPASTRQLLRKGVVSTPRVDYASLADSYDKGRGLSPAEEALWQDLFERYLDLNADSHVLDVGCGTGRFSVLMARQAQCAAVGLDPSSSMLAKAFAKCACHVDWVLARAEAMPLPDAMFDACLASQVVHHFQDKDQAFAEMYRVLRPGGRLGIRYSSHAQLRTILDYSFFPSALAIDLARLPDVHVLKGLMQATGFAVVEEHVVCQQLFESGKDYLEMVRSRYSSVLSLIAEEEHQKGLREIAAYLQCHEFREQDRYAEITFIVGVK
jgi:ubiquinone/menaquinone biosynthesis C-methylase UbiE